MSDQDDVRGAPRATRAGGLLRWVCTNNPFYVISAGLFFAGLRISFGASAEAIDAWALLSGLAGYILLLAVTACVLGRFARVWDDLRTVLLLVVLMFLAASVTFDEALVNEPDRGIDICLIGLAFAVVVSEVLLRTIRLWLPDGFKVPYYLALVLFFLYPLAISPLVAEPHDERLLWALFGFSTAAGLIVLTLLPAARRGAGYVAENGSPWRWPLYPWTLFGVLGFAVPARAYLLCVSMHVLDGPESRDGRMFGPFFLVPFGLALAVLLLQIARTSRSPRLLGVAMAAPVVLVALAMLGHRETGIYGEFLDIFRARLGAGPLYLTLCAGAGFYLFATLRGVRSGLDGLTAALAALAFVAPHAVEFSLRTPDLVPLLSAAALQLGIGMTRRQAPRCLVGGLAVSLLAPMVMPPELLHDLPPALIATHLTLFTLLAVGAMATGWFGQVLRDAGTIGVALICAAALFLHLPLPASIEPWTLQVYPVAVALLLAAYGFEFRHPFTLVIARLIFVCVAARAATWGYLSARHRVSGLDYLALSLCVFFVALGISLGKSGVLRDWLGQRRERAVFLLGVLSIALGVDLRQSDVLMEWLVGREELPEATDS